MRFILAMALLCSAILFCGALAEDTPASVAVVNVPQENYTYLLQDSGTNISEMNFTTTISPNIAIEQVVKFAAPKHDWKLEEVYIMATDNWNSSVKETPKPLPFTIEIRDGNLKLLYYYEGVQLPYFTSSTGIRMARIELPAVSVNGAFYVCFNGFGSIPLAFELENSTGNSYYYDFRTGQLISGFVQTGGNRTIPVNWLIRVAGQ